MVDIGDLLYGNEATYIAVNGAQWCQGRLYGVSGMLQQGCVKQEMLLDLVWPF